MRMSITKSAFPHHPCDICPVVPNPIGQFLSACPPAIIGRGLCGGEQHFSPPTLSPSSMKTLLTPGICLLAVAALVHTGLIAPGAAVISYAFYGAWIAGLLLAWRFHSTRIFSALLVLFLAQQALS